MLSPSLTDQQFLRYQRQISLPEIQEIGQSKLNKASVLIVGCGGLGSASALYLSASGVGQLVIADGDTVESSNLQRQVIYQENDIGSKKVIAMKRQLSALNSDTKVRVVDALLDGQQLDIEVMMADIVVDCSDNIETRQAINLACYQHKTPLVSGSAIGWKGQLTTFSYQNGTPCYHCLFPYQNLPQASSCNELGIMGPVVGVIGNLQALQVIKLLTQSCRINFGEIHLFDGLELSWETLTFSQDSDCSVCQVATPSVQQHHIKE